MKSSGQVTEHRAEHIRNEGIYLWIDFLKKMLTQKGSSPITGVQNELEIMMTPDDTFHLIDTMHSLASSHVLAYRCG